MMQPYFATHAVGALSPKQLLLTPPEDLGVRITYVTSQPGKTECDFAVPFAVAPSEPPGQGYRWPGSLGPLAQM